MNNDKIFLVMLKKRTFGWLIERTGSENGNTLLRLRQKYWQTRDTALQHIGSAPRSGLQYYLFQEFCLSVYTG